MGIGCFIGLIDIVLAHELRCLTSRVVTGAASVFPTQGFPYTDPKTLDVGGACGRPCIGAGGDRGGLQSLGADSILTALQSDDGKYGESEM